MNGSRILLAVTLLALSCSVASRLRAVETETLRTREQIQQRARQTTRRLICDILDLQLQQLKENRLEGLSIYRDIKTMRDEIDTLVDDQMKEVVDLLVAAQQGDRQQRTETFGQVRDKIREIVVKLSTERQKLLRRLRIAKLQSQIRQIIARQTTVYNMTGSLLEQPREQRETLTLAARGDQRDIQALYTTLSSALADVSGWGGTIGGEALAGLQTFKQDGVAAHLETALLALEAIDRFQTVPESQRIATATVSQKKILESLAKLLPKIDLSRESVGTDRKAALEMVREMMQRQKQLRDQTRTARLDDNSVMQLTTEQSNIRKRIGQLGKQLQELSGTAPFVQQARDAAQKASENLFESSQDAATIDTHRAEALAEQDKVLGNLAAIEERLKNTGDFTQSDKTADQLDAQVEALEAAREKVHQIEQTQNRAAVAVEKTPAKTESLEKQVAKALADVDSDSRADSDLPAAVKARLDHAEDAAEQAAQATADAPAKATAPQRWAVKQASNAVEQLTAEIEAALDDTKRRALGVKIGELARAAEALERAAAAEHEIARQANAAANAQGLEKTEAAALAGKQRQIAEVARDVAKGVAQTARDVAEQLKKAEQPIAAATKQLDAAEQSPGEASKVAAAGAAQQAQQAAKAIEKAAAGLRKEIGKAADALDTEAESQLGDLAEARERIEAAIDPTGSDSARAIEQLEKAAEKIQQAQSEQNKAAGRKQAEGTPADKRDAGATKAARKTAQQNVGKLADEARQAAANAAPKAARSAGEAAAASDQAETALQQGDRQAASAPQAAADDALKKAAGQIKDALQDQAAQQSKQLGLQAKQAPGKAARAADEAQAGLREAAANIAVREQQVRRDQAIAQEIAGLAQQQQAAREAISENSEQLAQLAEPAEGQGDGKGQGEAEGQGEGEGQSDGKGEGQAPGASPSAAQLKAATGLAKAQQHFAKTQRQLGQGAVEVSGQQQVANQPIRSALETASQLGNQDAASPPSGQGQAEGQGQGQSGGELGTGFVPSSPDVTAKMIAGSQAAAAMAALAQGQGQGQGQGEGQGQGKGKPGQPSAASALGDGGGSSKGGSETQNQFGGEKGLQLADGPKNTDSRSNAQGADAKTPNNTFREPPWFARLPKEQQQAIRADARRRAPRGYEERLKRYFESIGR